MQRFVENEWVVRHGGLRELIDKGGFMLSGVTRLEVTGCGVAEGRLMREGFRNEGLDAPEIIPAGSMCVMGSLRTRLQSFSVRG